MGTWLLIALFGLQAPTRATEVELPGLGIKLKAGWRLVVHDHCRYAVPATWNVNGDAALVTAPDGSRLTISRMQSWNRAAFRAPTRRAGESRTIVHEDNDVRVWIEFDDPIWHEHHIAVASGATTCAAVVELSPLRPDGDEIVHAIAQSLGPVPD